MGNHWGAVNIDWDSYRGNDATCKKQFVFKEIVPLIVLTYGRAMPVLFDFSEISGNIRPGQPSYEEIGY